jgi:hypothetical protein
MPQIVTTVRPTHFRERDRRFKESRPGTRLHSRHADATRLSATLARGTDRFNHFDHEAAPQAELDAAALAVHADSQSRYWQAASSIAEMRHIH